MAISRVLRIYLAVIAAIVVLGIVGTIARPRHPVPSEESPSVPNVAEEAPKVSEEVSKSELDRKAAEETAKAAAREEAGFLKTSAGKVWQKHKDWDRDICKVVAGRMVRIGMTAEQVRAAWGKPGHINSTIYRSGTHEQWVYRDSQYVYLEDGVVTSLQDTR